MLQLDLDGARKAVEAQATLHAEQLEQQGRNLAGQVTAGVTQIEKLQVRGCQGAELSHSRAVAGRSIRCQMLPPVRARPADPVITSVRTGGDQSDGGGIGGRSDGGDERS